ncbi:hypothetical protein [Rhodopirellula islandica]|uniref:hypothetical protein n=1 Tax=Rhodopirellula islandica TaxID=595434 RepID=UPI0012377C2F|nr:hypothetical protein [Rhodopirellula islandica]
MLILNAKYTNALAEQDVVFRAIGQTAPPRIKAACARKRQQWVVTFFERLDCGIIVRDGLTDTIKN